eukprot:TRINITY_DN6817_c0_g1_i1.p1 TRINITY_DN6817_c0_g1~~TRINITY_DN6817_c0_g1_i1.p1  ORF type:complete len:219 (+),score=43.04 TRINITY_DN6817_c0_g1_i1:221-877(+)
MTPSILLVFALSGLLLTHAKALSYEDCGISGGLVDVADVKMTPDPAVSGGQMTFTIPATSTVSITGGNVLVLVMYRGIPVHVERDPLCGKTKCPVAPGEKFIFENSQPLPTVTPAGSYVVRMSAFNQDNKLLFCEKVSFDIVKPSSSPMSFSEKLGAFARSLFIGAQEDAGAIIEAAEKVWNFPEDSKIQLRRALAARDSWKWNAQSTENYEERLTAV